MSIRSDVTINWSTSPRILTIAAPSTEITVQDIVDTCRNFEDLSPNSSRKKLIDAAGKEFLGGVTYVGITATLQDAIIAFEARLGPDWVLCTVSGGNIVALDSAGADIDPRHPTAFITVDRTASASATLQEQSAIQYSSFGGGVTVDVVNGTAGTEYPTGTVETPVNNLADAVTIANTRGFVTLFINKDMTLDGGTDIQDFDIIGRSRVKTNIVIDTGAICNGIGISNCKVSGVLDGNVRIDNCSVGDLLYVYGHIMNSALYGNITLAGNEDAYISNCSLLDVNNAPTIDMGGSGQDIFLADWSGDINFKNLTGANEINIQLDGGRVYLENTISAGTIVVSGTGELFDSTTGTATVETDGLMSKATIATTIYDEIGTEIQYASFGDHVTINPTSGSAGTTYPTGTIESPVDNIPDALLIAVSRGFNSLYFQESMNITGVDITGYTIIGDSCVHTQLTIDVSATSNNITVKNCDLSGTVGGKIKVHGCMVGDLTDVNGQIFNSSLYGTITLGGALDSSIADCFMRHLSSIPAIDMGGSGQNMFLSDWSGAMKVRNMTGATNYIGCQLDGGKVFIEPTVSAGMVGIVGIGTIVDTSTGTADIDTIGLINNDAIAADVWDEPMSGHTTSGTFGNYIRSKLLSVAKFLALK